MRQNRKCIECGDPLTGYSFKFCHPCAAARLRNYWNPSNGQKSADIRFYSHARYQTMILQYLASCNRDLGCGRGEFISKRS